MTDDTKMREVLASNDIQSIIFAIHRETEDAATRDAIEFAAEEIAEIARRYAALQAKTEVTDEMVMAALGAWFNSGRTSDYGPDWAKTHARFVDGWKLDMRSALMAALGDRKEWQPIETAPKGRAVLIYKPNTNEQYVAAYITGEHGPGWCDQSGCQIFRPSHWRPLPEPPAALATKEKA